MKYQKQTLAEAMALAVIRGDMVAAYALADMLIMEKNAGDGGVAAQAASVIRGWPIAHIAGYDVYNSPEFEAFARKFGIAWDLNTVNMTIHLPADGPMSVIQEYRGSTPNG